MGLTFNTNYARYMLYIPAGNKKRTTEKPKTKKEGLRLPCK
jgi:hypothetical protein